MPDPISELISRWAVSVSNAERAAAEELVTSPARIRYDAIAETYRQCAADLRAARKRPGGN